MSEAKESVRIALLGCGTVGGGVIRLLTHHRERLAARTGARLDIVSVVVRDATTVRVPECRTEWVTTDAESVLDDPTIDLFVEVMGGEQPAKAYIERVLDRGKSVVSATKFLLARHGADLVKRAADAGAGLAFEASVGGGIPVIRTLRESLTSDSVESVHGILNGTCNYILTQMQEEGTPFEEVLADAQRLGYAEAEPSLDVDGHDAAQKLVVISMLAFGAKVAETALSVEGIREIDQTDFNFAERFEFCIKHLAVGRDHGDRLELRVHPAMIPRTSVLSNVNDVLNGVFVNGKALGPCLLVGRGAGAMPTAVSVVADIVDVARAILEGSPGLSTRSIDPRERELVPIEEVETRHYLRFDVGDEPGVLALIAGELGKQGVSIEQMVQDGRAKRGGEAVSVLIITHKSPHGAVRRALAVIDAAPFMTRPARLIRIEDV